MGLSDKLGRAALSGGRLAATGAVAAARAGAGAVAKRRATAALGRLPDDVLARALADLDTVAAGGPVEPGVLPAAVAWPRSTRRHRHDGRGRDLRGPDVPAPPPSTLVDAVLDLVDPQDPSVAVGGLLLRVPALEGLAGEAAELAVLFALDSVLGGAGEGDATDTYRTPREHLGLCDAQGRLLAWQPVAGKTGPYVHPRHERFGPDGCLVARTVQGGSAVLHPDGVVALHRDPEGLLTDRDGAPAAHVERTELLDVLVPDGGPLSLLALVALLLP